MIKLPDHLMRHPTRNAIDALAKRFGLPNHPSMQDWEYQVADPSRIDEFVAAYREDGLTEDERFVLMEMILQSFEDLESGGANDPRWSHVLGLLEFYIDIHIATVWYWAALDNDRQDAWKISPYMRTVLNRHRRQFERVR